jgi:DNA-binding MarR family transcriptional regulator
MMRRLERPARKKSLITVGATVARDNASLGSQHQQQHSRQLALKGRFDSNGARKGAIALLTAIYKTGRHNTLAEVLIALEVIDSNLDGRPHSMKSLSSKLGIPYTSVSRIVYSLTSEAQPGGILKLVPDSKDRRRKHIELDMEAFKRSNAQIRALEKAMIDYYGNSVYKLKKDKSN